jgi:hypothetical protein
MESRPQEKLTIIGGGIVGAMEAYLAFLEAKKQGKPLRVTIYEKNKSISETTVSHIVPSLTPDEILSVVPRGQELVKKLKTFFSEPGGIRVDDVPEILRSEAASQFIQYVQKEGEDELAHNARTKTLLEMGKMSMAFWKNIYDNADDRLRKILLESNFNPCYEPKESDVDKLHNGYRIDLIYNIKNAKEKAETMASEYKQLHYNRCKILSPKEVVEKDPFLKDFCEENSEKNKLGELAWKDNAAALWRPGGCIDTQVFLPKLFSYLKEAMGQYVSESGKIKDCFRLKFERNVVAVDYSNEKKDTVNGLLFFGNPKAKHNKHGYKNSNYVFCPGEDVGGLRKLDFIEPPYAGFAGASLMLNIPVPIKKLQKYQNFNHCMEVHQEGVVLAWQARFKDNKIFIGVAGTKAFYGDQKPHVDHNFSKNRNLLQLNMINDILPEFISLALGKNTKGQKLTGEDLINLERNKIAVRWVGTRAVAYDGFPTLGSVYNKNSKVNNARCTTHLGSGGGSFSPAVVFFSRKALDKNEPDSLTKSILEQGDSKRTPRSRL